MTTPTDPRAAAEEALRLHDVLTDSDKGAADFARRRGDGERLMKLTPILARAVIEQADTIDVAHKALDPIVARRDGKDDPPLTLSRRATTAAEIVADLTRQRDEALTNADAARAELASLRAVAAAARDLSDAAHECDREAEQPAPSQSSAPLVRHIKAMAHLRTVLAAIPPDAASAEPTTTLTEAPTTGTLTPEQATAEILSYFGIASEIASRNRVLAIVRRVGPAPLTEGERFYVQDSRSYVGNAVLWWAKGRNGYTAHIDEAHEFTEAEAIEVHENRETDIPVPVRVARAAASLQVDAQRLTRRAIPPDVRAGESGGVELGCPACNGEGGQAHDGGTFERCRVCDGSRLAPTPALPADYAARRAMGEGGHGMCEPADTTPIPRRRTGVFGEPVTLLAGLDEMAVTAGEEGDE